MKNKFILIYVYNSLLEEELLFWERLNSVLLEKGYSLFLLLRNIPKRKVAFQYSYFTERLDNVVFPKEFHKKYKNIDFKEVLEREYTWYGKSEQDRLTAAKFQKYKYSILLMELNPCLLVLGNGQHAGELILKEEGNRLGVPIIYIERGPLPNSWHIDKLGMTAGTEIAKLDLTEFNLNEDVANYLKYKSFYLNSKFTWWHQPEKIENYSIRGRFDIPEKKKVLLFANQLDNDTSNFLYNPFFKNNLDAFSWFCENINKQDFCCFVLIKKHPHYKGNEVLFQQIMHVNHIEGAWVDDIPLEDCVAQSDMVCAVNSTLLFEALIYGKPVLQLGDSLLNNKNIVYQIKNKVDYITLRNWFTQDDFENKLNNFQNFMTYMIDNELSFFFKDAEKMGFNYVNFFIERILVYQETTNKGRYPNKFLKINNISNKKTFLFKIRRKLKIYFKISLILI